MRKVVILYLAPLVLLWGLSACSYQEQVALISEESAFVSLLRTEEFTVEEFLSELAGFNEMYTSVFPLLNKLTGNITINAYVIAYNTVDPDGQPVVSSGVIYVPQDKRIRGVVEMTPVAYVQKNQGASERMPTMEAVSSCFGYITLMADYLGFGITQDQLPHPYLHVENTGRVAYDMRRASREFLSTLGYQLPKKTLIAGYSLGASMALAIARYYQLYAPDVKVEALYMGGGCYDLEVALNAFAKKGISEYSIVPTIVHSMDQIYQLHLDYSKVFKGALLEHYVEWLDRAADHDAEFLTEQMGTDMHAYIHEDFFTEAKNEEFEKIYQVARLNSHVNGWTPKFPIKLFYATDDFYVPWECSEYLIKEFRSRGANLFVMSGEGGHLGFAAPLFIDFFVYLLVK